MTSILLSSCHDLTRRREARELCLSPHCKVATNPAVRTVLLSSANQSPSKYPFLVLLDTGIRIQH